MTEVNYTAINAARQTKIDQYMAAFNAAGFLPRNVPLPIPYQLWDAFTWNLRLMLGPRYQGPRIVLNLNNDPSTKFRIMGRMYSEFVLIGAGVPDAMGRNNAPDNLVWRWVASDTGEIMQPGRGVMWLEAQRRGAKVEQKLVHVPGLNAYDITNDFVWDDPDEEAQVNLMAYDVEAAPLMTDPVTWPKKYRDPFMAGHPGYKFPGVTKFQPWIHGTENPFK